MSLGLASWKSLPVKRIVLLI